MTATELKSKSVIEQVTVIYDIIDTDKYFISKKEFLMEFEHILLALREVNRSRPCKSIDDNTFRTSRIEGVVDYLSNKII